MYSYKQTYLFIYKRIYTFIASEDDKENNKLFFFDLYSSIYRESQQRVDGKKHWTNIEKPWLEEFEIIIEKLS